MAKSLVTIWYILIFVYFTNFIHSTIFTHSINNIFVVMPEKYQNSLCKINESKRAMAEDILFMKQFLKQFKERATIRLDRNFLAGKVVSFSKLIETLFQSIGAFMIMTLCFIVIIHLVECIWSYRYSYLVIAVVLVVAIVIAIVIQGIVKIY